MNYSDLRQKLITLSKRYSFVSERMEYLVDITMDTCRNMYPNYNEKSLQYAIKIFKGEIRKEIILSFKENNIDLFKRFVKFQYSNKNIRLRVLDSLIRAVEYVDRDFYKKLLENVPEIKEILDSLIVSHNDGKKIIDKDRLKQVSSLRPLLLKYISDDQLVVEVQKDEKYILTYSEVKDLYDRIKSGDREARNILINENMELVFKISSWYHSSLIDTDDLVQEGIIGLYDAIDEFNPELGFSFSTYATYHIRKRISKYIHDNMWGIKVPCGARDNVYLVKKAIRAIENEELREPTYYDLIDKEISKSAIRDFYALSTLMPSLDDSINDNGRPTSLGDLISSSDDFSSKIYDDMTSISLIEDVKNILTEREYSIVAMANGLEDGIVRDVQEIAIRFGVKRQRVEQILEKAYSKLANRETIRTYDINDKERREIQRVCGNDSQLCLYILSKIGIKDGYLLTNKKSKLYVSDFEEIHRRAIEALRSHLSPYLETVLRRIEYADKPKKKVKSM